MTIEAQNQDSQPWKCIARNKKASRDAKIPLGWRLKPGQISDDQLNVINAPNKCGILTTREREITAKSAKTLVCEIESREYSSYEVCCW